GVYATTATIDGVVRPSITNIGVRPTIDRSGRMVTETHIFAFDAELYGTTLRVGFVQRLRDERALDWLELLKAQIAADCARARRRARDCRLAGRSTRLPDVASHSLT